MHTRITIKHADVEALKASPIWAEIMRIAFSDEAVSVVEIAAVDASDEE